DDASNAVNSTPQLVITVDTVAPTANITSPANATITADTTPEITFTLTDNVDTELNFTVFVDGTANITGAVTNDTSTGVNLSALGDGVHTVVVEARDEVGISTNSSAAAIVIDTTSPAVFNFVPTAGSQFNVSASVPIQANVTEGNNIDTVTANVTFPNSTTQLLTLVQIGATDVFNATFALGGLQGQYNVTYFANDSVANANTTGTTFFVGNSTDSDGDGVPDILDTLEGNETSVSTSGITSLNVTIGGVGANGTFTGEQEVIMQDSGSMLLNFSHNFSAGQLDLSLITLTVTSTSFVVNMGGQLQAGQTKTLFITDNSFIGLCVKDQEITSASEISSGCTGANETDFDACLGNSTGVTINGTTCTDLGSTIKIENLTFSGISGSQAAAAATTGGGGGGGGGGRKLNQRSDLTKAIDDDGMTEFQLQSSSQFYYMYKGREYRFLLGLNTQLNGRLAIKIDPAIESLELQMHAPVDVDLDGNGVSDIRVTLVRRYYTSGVIRVEKLEEAAPQNNFVPQFEPPKEAVEEPETETATADTEEEQAPAVEEVPELEVEKLEVAPTRSWWQIMGLSVLVLVAIIVFFVYELHEHGQI
ncbi:MAG: hypothetical protein ACE5FT_05025, partial [Candidatus Nanoarchaeia archaeon]